MYSLLLRHHFRSPLSVNADNLYDDRPCPIRGDLLKSAKPFCNSLADNKPAEEVIYYFSTTYATFYFERGLPALAPFLGRTFTRGQRSVLVSSRNVWPTRARNALRIWSIRKPAKSAFQGVRISRGSKWMKAEMKSSHTCPTSTAKPISRIGMRGQTREPFTWPRRGS